MTRATDLCVEEETHKTKAPSRDGDATFLRASINLLVCALVAAGMALPAHSAESSIDLDGRSKLSQADDVKIEVPAVLTEADAARYARIYEAQREGDWAVAHREVAQLSNRVLMGYVLFQRYMHPTAYHSTYDELKRWLDRYADHPEAIRIYRLAMKRRPKGAKAPKEPIGLSLSLGAWSEANPVDGSYRSNRGPGLSFYERDLIRRIQAHVGNGRPSAALSLLRDGNDRQPLRAHAYDLARARIAASYFFEGLDEKAFALAIKSAKRSRGSVESADWIAGLAAWRLGRFADAQKHFEALAYSNTASPWNIAAGAYWAARSYLVDRQPIKVNPLLAVAAEYPRTFYGLLSARLLGEHNDFHWGAPPLTRSEAAQLTEIPAITRVIALAEMGRHDLADLELRGIYLSGREALGAALVGLANRLQIPATQLRLARSYSSGGGRTYDAALFPTPPWKPAGGFRIDRALVYAFMRQESGFVVTAQSEAGARGLMQIMPRTASYVAKDKSLRDEGKDKLLAPEFNIEIGQRYLAYLLKDRRIHGNLLHLAVAYNSGPGKLNKWLKTLKHGEDPLMFMESIPSRETRFFVERVLTNFWIYRERLRQDSPSLDAVATGHWPIYLSLDAPGLEVAQSHGRN